MDKKPTPPKLPPRPAAPAQLGALPPLPSLDRGSPPVPQQSQPALMGPQKLESHEAKLAVQRSMCDSMIPVRLSDPFPCGVHPCLNYTNSAQLSYDLTFQMYRISVVCPECMKKPRP